MVNTEVERYSEVDTADVPSAAWGWSKITPRTWYALGIFIIVFLLGMMHGNHVGHVENWFLIGFAAIVAFVMIRDWVMRRRGQLR
jgi:purine-cytosine permease-like protein